MVERVATWKLHLKPLPQRIDTVSLSDLSAIEVERFADFEKGREYLDDPATFSAVPRCDSRSVPLARITPEHSAQLLENGIFEPLVDPSEVRGSVNYWLRAEVLKERYRLITHPPVINDRLPPAPAIAFTSVQCRRAIPAIPGATHMLQVDFASYYNQFLQTPAVRNWYCARLPDPSGGKPLLCRLRVAPTGLSHMVFAAVAATRLLLSFEKQSVFTDDHIDNVLFVGSKEAVIADAKQLFARCATAGVTINEDISAPEKLVTTAGDWCGLHLDLVNKTVALTDKLVLKTRLSLSGAEGWTYRGFAAHMGLLFYAMQVIDIPVCSFFNLLRFVSNASRDMQADDTRWDTPAVIDASAMSDVKVWTALVVANVACPSPAVWSPSVFVLVDACKRGWGYIAVDESTGAFFSHGSVWGPEFAMREQIDDLRHSVFTETHGIIQAKRHLLAQLPPSASRHVAIANDNVTAVSVLRKGYTGKSFRLNSAAAYDRANFSSASFRYLNVPGNVDELSSIVDDLSRGRDPKLASKDIRAISESLRRLLGVSLVDSDDLAPSNGGGQAELSCFPSFSST